MSYFQRPVCFVCPIGNVLEIFDINMVVYSLTGDAFQLRVLNRFSLEKEHWSCIETRE